MFRGSAPTKIDDKGRLKVPTEFRRILEESFGPEVFVTSLHGDSAILYPLPVWEEIERKLMQVPSSSSSKQRYLARVNYFGQQLRLDSQGRIVLPQILREHAEMAGEAIVSGRLDRLEIWNRDRFARKLELEPFSDDDAQTLTDYGI
jgi:MraZ protein